jgi:hypothetical protein
LKGVIRSPPEKRKAFCASIPYNPGSQVSLQQAPMEADSCVEALEEALAKHGKPEIFNTAQDSQFTGSEFIGVLTTRAIAISMDGKGSWSGNDPDRLSSGGRPSELLMPTDNRRHRHYIHDN